MASSHQPITRKLTSGIDQSKQRHLIEPSSCWDMINMRAMRGRLEQTPWLENFFSFTEVSYPVHLIKLVNDSVYGMQYLVINEHYPILVNPVSPISQQFFNSAQLDSKPQDISVRGECLVYGWNAIDNGGAGGVIIQIHTDGSHFRFSINAGVTWSADLVIGPNVQLTVNGLYASFQGSGAVGDYTGYTVGNTWAWVTNSSVVFALVPHYTTKYFSYSTDGYLNDLYIGGVNRKILRLRDGFLTTVGYTSVFGMHVAVYQEHLFVSQFAMGAPHAITGAIDDTFNAKTTPWVIGWSQLDNPDQFFATIINEADQKSLSQQTSFEQGSIGITGLVVWRGLLYVFLTDAIHTGQYVGLPNVMQFTPLNGSIGSIFRAGVVKTPKGVYCIGRNNVYRITQYEPEAIGDQVRTKFFSDIAPITTEDFQKTFGFYNPESQEIIWTYWARTYIPDVYRQRQMVFNELTGDWYFRNIPCLFTGDSDTLAGAPLYGGTGESIYGYVNFLAKDQAVGSTAVALYDDRAVGVDQRYTTPFIETGFLDYGDPFHVKENSGLLIDAGWTSGKSIQVAQATKELIGTGEATMINIDQVWTPALSEVRLSLPRTSYRQTAYKMSFNGTDATHPPYGAVLNLYQEFVRGPQTQVEK